MSNDRRGSLRLIRLAGIDVYLHWSWFGIVALLLLGFRGQLAERYPDLGAAGAWVLAAFGSAVFLGSVVVHEFAHALVAKARGITVEGITLYLFGGATEADASSRTAVDEFVVAIVGPLTSLGLAAALWAATAAIPSDAEALGGVVGYLALINLVLALFNMTPGLPLDGGRVFRSLVWYVTGDFAKATRWATSAGVMVGYFMIGVGLLSLWQGALAGIWIAAIGWMISQGARATDRQEEIRRTFTGLVAADLMTTGVVTIPAGATLADVIQSHFVDGNHAAFPVVDEVGIVGMLGLPEVRMIERELWPTSLAGGAASPIDSTLIVEPEKPMADVIALLEGSRQGSRVLVSDGGHLRGIVSPGDIVRRMALAALLDAS